MDIDRYIYIHYIHRTQNRCGKREERERERVSQRVLDTHNKSSIIYGVRVNRTTAKFVQIFVSINVCRKAVSGKVSGGAMATREIALMAGHASIS